MASAELITFTRDCNAILIPYGEKVVLKEGEQATITQALGGNYTLLIRGSLVRVDGKDADALGKEPTGAETPETDTAISPEKEKSEDEVDEQTVWEAMRTCYDPEIPVNIVDLGLVYSCEFFRREGVGTRVEVKMTLTAPGCGMGGPISEEVTDKILGVPGVAEAQVDLVWDPPWNHEMMSEGAKLQLGML